jgi:hypothetical protein
MSDNEFSLRQVALAVLADSDSEDRGQIIKEIEHRVAREDLADALREALPAFVHQVAPRWTVPVPGEQGAGQRNSARSSKVGAIREAWRKHLEGRYTVEDGSLRRVGDFTCDDLLFVADGLEARARANFARAASMKALAGKLAAHEAEHVRDLPAEVLREFFGAADEGGETA